MPTEKNLLISKLFFTAAFPVMKVVLEDDPKMKEKFKDTSGVVQIGAKTPDGIFACRLIFTDGELSIQQGAAGSEDQKPDVNIEFPSLETMNKMFRGGMDAKVIGTLLKSFTKSVKSLGLFIKVLTLLMSLMLMMPSKRPKDPLKQRLKVKMSLYMITTALSMYNKDGDNEMSAWTAYQPDRIYQFTVLDNDINCYLRVKAGKSKAGRGVYERRRPFVHFIFSTTEGAMKVLLKEVEFVSGVEQGCVTIVGSPEYAAKLNDFMARLQSMLT